MSARFLAAGDTAVTIELARAADPAISRRVQALCADIAERKLSGLIEIVPTIRSLTLHYDPCRTSARELRHAVAPLLEGPAAPQTGAAARPNRRWLIPACYEPEHGIDIEDVCWTCGLHPATVVEIHAGQPWRVLMVGFLPGQPYLGELPPLLRLPRRASPRISVAAGSIGIAMSMSVVYPQASPGGWHIIARTPVPLFDAFRAQPSLLAAGDEVSFQPVTSREFDRLAARAAANELHLQPAEAAA